MAVSERTICSPCMNSELLLGFLGVQKVCLAVQTACQSIKGICLGVSTFYQGAAILSLCVQTVCVGVYTVCVAVFVFLPKSPVWVLHYFVKVSSPFRLEPSSPKNINFLLRGQIRPLVLSKWVKLFKQHYLTMHHPESLVSSRYKTNQKVNKKNI